MFSLCETLQGLLLVLFMGVTCNYIPFQPRKENELASANLP